MAGHPARGAGQGQGSPAQALIPRVYKRAAARNDLIEHYAYLAVEAGEDTADRFLQQADSSFTLPASQPKIGALLTLRAPDLAGMRKWRVSGA